MEHEIISRKEAKTRGLGLYFTGSPCKRGHIAPHRVSGICVICEEALKEKNKAKKREYDLARNESLKGRIVSGGKDILPQKQRGSS